MSGYEVGLIVEGDFEGLGEKRCCNYAAADEPVVEFPNLFMALAGENEQWSGRVLTISSNSKKASESRCAQKPFQSWRMYVTVGVSLGFHVGALMLIFLKPM